MVFDVFGRGSKTPPKSGAPPAQGKPLHLLRFDEGSKKFTLGEEALDCLRAVKGPVGVLSVCGRARQGKSFILNQLAGAAASNDAGFKVGPTVKPCTKGLWIWSAPIPTRSSDGQAYHLILLDTEGIDAYDQTGQYSTQIFSMAVLLSSLFVYNQMGGIDEAALDRLSLVTEMTKHIRVRSDEGGGRGRTSAAELGRFSPSFVWLLRDFYLDLADSDVDGGPSRSITPAEYLERALRAVDRGGPGAEAKNAIRDSIKALFPERECFPLVRPVNDERALRNLDTTPRSALRPEFIEGLGRLIDTLFSRCAPKRIGGDVVTGPALASLAEAYAAALDGGAVPAIASAWQSVAEAECRKAADAALEAYDEAFLEAFIDDDDDGADAAHAARAPPRASSSTPARSAPRGPVRGATRSMRWTPNSRRKSVRGETTRRARVYARRASPPRARGSAPSPTPPTPPPTTSSPPPTPRRRPSPPTPGSARAPRAPRGVDAGRRAERHAGRRRQSARAARAKAGARRGARGARRRGRARSEARAETAERALAASTRRVDELGARVVDAEKASAEARRARARQPLPRPPPPRTPSSSSRRSSATSRRSANPSPCAPRSTRRSGARRSRRRRAAAETELAAARRDGASARAKTADETRRAEEDAVGSARSCVWWSAGKRPR